MPIGGINVGGVRAANGVLAAAGAIGVANAGIVLAGWGQEPKRASEKVGTAISHGAMLGTTTIVSKGGNTRILLLGALAGDVTGNLLSAAVHGSDPDAPNPRPGSAWDDIVGGAVREARETAGRSALIGGGAGLALGAFGGRLLKGSWPAAIKIALLAGGADAGLGTVSGGLSGTWRGVYDGTGIAIGRGIDAVRVDR